MDKEKIKFKAEHQESIKDWVKEADEDKRDLEEFQEEKIKKAKRFSWILVVFVLFLISILGEGIVYSIGDYLFIKEIKITILIWFWRIILINFYLYFSYFKMHLPLERIFIIAIIALVASVLVSIVFKILFINNTWVYLNLLIEPIWLVLLVALFSSLYTRFIFKN